MAQLPILVAPDPRLAKKSLPVAEVDGEIRQLMDDMLETMYAAPVIVLDLAGDDEAPSPFKMANPEIIWVSDDDAEYNEGCLSVPEHYADVVRPASCVVRYLDENNVQREITAEGLLSTCVQHEIDHLDGVLFIDHLTSLKRNIILRKLVKAKKAGAGGVPA